MQQSERVYPIQLALNCDGEVLISSLYWEGFEAHAEAELPSDLLKEYRHGLSLATTGVSTAGEALRPLADTMVGVAIPDNARQHLRELAKEALQGRLVTLEVMIDDSTLEAYPWELLSHPGGLLPKEVDIAIWRSVDPEIRPTKDFSDSILLVGSAPIDSISPHTHRELELIIEGIGTRSGIIPYPYPAISFGKFRSLLSRLRPAVLHLVVHGDVKSFRFQDDSNSDWSLFQESQHADIHYQEFVDYVKRSTATAVVVLNACDSASALDGEMPVARQLAIAGELAAIGMAGKLPVRVGMAFSQAFHHNLAHGTSIIEAFSAGVRNILRLPSPDADFWSIPMLYSAQSNVVVFPADLEARVRRALRHVRAVQSDIDELGWEPAWSAGDWAEHTVALGVRLDYVRSALPSLADGQPARQGGLFRRLSLRQACQSLEWHLEGTADCLQQLADPDTPDRVRRELVQQLQAQRPQLVGTLTQLDLLVNGSS
jgi:hypothetical protein